MDGYPYYGKEYGNKDRNFCMGTPPVPPNQREEDILLMYQPILLPNSREAGNYSN